MNHPPPSEMVLETRMLTGTPNGTFLVRPKGIVHGGVFNQVLSCHTHTIAIVS